MRAGVLVRRLGWYGETAASGMPSEPSAAKHAPWLQFSELRPMQRAVASCLSCHGRGPVPLSCARSQQPARDAISSGDGLQRAQVALCQEMPNLEAPWCYNPL
jgi:hypothetical protein